MLSSFPRVRRGEGVGKGGIHSLTWLGLARMALLAWHQPEGHQVSLWLKVCANSVALSLVVGLAPTSPASRHRDPWERACPAALWLLSIIYGPKAPDSGAWGLSAPSGFSCTEGQEGSENRQNERWLLCLLSWESPHDVAPVTALEGSCGSAPQRQGH